MPHDPLPGPAHCPVCGRECERIDYDLFEPVPCGYILHADRHTGRQSTLENDR